MEHIARTPVEASYNAVIVNGGGFDAKSGSGNVVLSDSAGSTQEAIIHTAISADSCYCT